MSEQRETRKTERTLGQDDRFLAGSDLYQSQITQGGQAFLKHVHAFFLEQFEQFMNLSHVTTEKELAARYWRLRGILDCRADQQHQIEYATNLARALLRKKGLL